ncbi:MAG TPA: hypothetical protein VG873_09675 [Burkholderiales bacterium]|nr:hypothetical protein [Burkholderiales bacterium]
MTEFQEKLLTAVADAPGRTDRELTDSFLTRSDPPSRINQEARLLESRGVLIRRKRADGLIGNYPAKTSPKLGLVRS